MRECFILTMIAFARTSEIDKRVEATAHQQQSSGSYTRRQTSTELRKCTELGKINVILSI